MKKLLSLVLCFLLLTVSACASYIETVQAGQPIYQGPGYEYNKSGAVHEKGRYTIVSEQRDAAGRMWGKLKSGAGWVDLSDIRGEVIPPFTVSYADRASVSSDRYDLYIQEDSEYTSWLIFKASQWLENVQLVSFELAEAGLKLSRILHTQPELQSDRPLAAGVVFYGDMTAYGLLCTDIAGEMHCYTVTVSGEDGSLIVNECDLIAF